MSVKIIKTQNLTWVNIDKIDEQAINYLKQNHNFHQLDFEDLQSELQIPKIDIYKNYIFLVLQFPTWKAHTQSITPQEIDIFLGDGYLITIQNTKSKEMKNFFYKCMKNRNIKAGWMNSTSGFLLYKLVESLFLNGQPVLNNIGKHLSEIEQEIFNQEPNSVLVKKLAIHRRNVLSFRRILDPQRHIISNITHIKKTFLDDTLSLYFDNVNDYLAKNWSIVETYKETIEGLHATVESLLTRRTNKVVAYLTAISASFMPLTLLSGIYGMNIDNLPYANHPFIIWIFFGWLATIILIILFLMKKRGIM